MVYRSLPAEDQNDDKMSLNRSNTNSSWGSTFTVVSEAPGDEQSPDSSHAAVISFHPTAAMDGLLVKVETPRMPREGADGRAGCDIVLVIDVSDSMGQDAPVPGGDAEGLGLSVLDLTKHAARAILATLDHRDRLGIVTFSTDAIPIQQLVPMTNPNKHLAEKTIDSMKPYGMTNLWSGIREGLGLFDNQLDSGRVPAVFVLTDGQPNHMCPAQGYIPKLRKMERLPATIHTFGFGYNLRSGLLKSLAEVSGGNYAYIPDAGMIGTVFIHAVANLQSTFADRATLTLEYRKTLALEETTGARVDKTEPIEFPNGTKQLTISLGNLQYGQSREIYLGVTGGENSGESVAAVLSYSRMTSPVHYYTTSRLMSDASHVSEAEMAYHQSRSMVCALLASLFPLRCDEEHVFNLNLIEEKRGALAELIESIPARRFPTDSWNQSLMNDLCGNEPRGQIALALCHSDYLNRWGIHYLPSLLNAYTRQICNSFKDSGPLKFGADSPLFVACRDRLDAAFEKLPAPKPSNRTRYEGPVDMGMYHRADNPCFSAETPVALADGQLLAISQLRQGTCVQTPAGPRSVRAVLCTPANHQPMCRVGEWYVTPWHPVSTDDAKSYVFPISVASNASSLPPQRVAVSESIYSGLIYSILLQSDTDPAAHAIQVGAENNALWGVTLGHGIKSGDDVRAHNFFGDWTAVDANLCEFVVEPSGQILCGGVERKDGLVCRFRKPSRLIPTTS